MLLGWVGRMREYSHVPMCVCFYIGVMVWPGSITTLYGRLPGMLFLQYINTHTKVLTSLNFSLLVLAALYVCILYVHTYIFSLVECPTCGVCFVVMLLCRPVAFLSCFGRLHSRCQLFVCFLLCISIVIIFAFVSTYFICI